jgi:hypothetical protein
MARASGLRRVPLYEKPMQISRSRPMTSNASLGRAAGTVILMGT